MQTIEHLAWRWVSCVLYASDVVDKAFAARGPSAKND